MFGNPKGEVRICSDCKRAHDILRGTRCWCACGKEIRSKQFVADHIQKDNHTIGCELESYTNILFYRGLNQEHDMLLEVASRLK